MDNLSPLAASGSLAPPHPAAFAQSFDDKVEAAVAFLRHGTDIRADCILVARRDDTDTWSESLRQRSLPVGDAPGAVIVTPIERWLPPRAVNSVRMARHLYERIEASRAESRQLYVAIDMAWTLETGTPSDVVCHCEATYDHLLLPEPDVRVLCIYGVHELGIDLLHAGIRTHSVIVVEGRAMPNPYFDAPAILEKEPGLNRCSTDPELVNGMLQHFRAAP